MRTSPESIPQLTEDFVSTWHKVVGLGLHYAEFSTLCNVGAWSNMLIEKWTVNYFLVNKDLQLQID